MMLNADLKWTDVVLITMLIPKKYYITLFRYGKHISHNFTIHADKQ